jgi:molecular chaperone GrpE
MEKKEVLENKEEIKEESIDWKDMYTRLYADMDNLKKRIKREKEESVIMTKTAMISAILDMDNDLNIALKSFKSVPSGIDLIIHKLKNFLDSQGIQEIESVKYNPDIHEVISVVETGEEKIIDVVSKGYKIGDKIIRYPKVIISR